VSAELVATSVLVSFLSIAGARWFLLEWFKERMLRDSLFDLFAEAAPSDGQVAETGIESDWLALKLCGFPIDARIRTLAAGDQARVVELSERVSVLGAKLVKKGLFSYYNFTVPTNIKLNHGQKINPPRSLFMLTPRGRAEVLRRRARKGEAQPCQSSETRA
jgi:hypothetical protein